MLNLLQKIFRVGTVTEKFDAAPVSERFRGMLHVEQNECSQCLRCVEACPARVLNLESGELTVEHAGCLFCGRCVDVCGQRLLKHTGEYKLATAGEASGRALGEAVKRKTRKLLRRSLHIRHVDAGSCNACDFEMGALNNPFYDLQQYGIDFVASPRHADLLMVTGVVTRNLAQALRMTYEAAPSPKLVMAVGACAALGKTYGSSYAIQGKVEDVVPVDVVVPGCPPRPSALLYGLLLALEKLPE